MQKSYHKIINYKGIYYYNFKKNILIKNSNLINALNVEDNVRKFEICQDNNKIIKKFILKKRKVLLLQVTQACNLRCKYCVYSDEFSRKPSNAFMSFDVAKKAVDLHFKHSVTSVYTNIGFYGGEPLLNFTLIKNIINYIKDNYPCRLVYYNITTNATLFNEEIIDFFIDNKINTMISLDGPKRIHDDKRLDIYNNGTFNKVIDTINHIKRKNKNYFNNHISFNSVTSNIYEQSIAEDFFIKKFKIKYDVGVFSYSKKISELKFSNQNIKTIENDIIRKSLITLFEYRSNVPITYKSGIINYRFLMKMRNINEKLMKSSTSEKIIKFHPKGQCIPSHTRCFVDVKGRFFPCEKTNELNDFLVIGNVYNDVNMKKATKVYNYAKFICCKCNDCWALHFCDLCVAKILESNFGNNVIDKYCEEVRKTTEIFLSALIVLKNIFVSYYYKCNKF